MNVDDVIRLIGYNYPHNGSCIRAREGGSTAYDINASLSRAFYMKCLAESADHKILVCNKLRQINGAGRSFESLKPRSLCRQTRRCGGDQKLGRNTADIQAGSTRYAIFNHRNGLAKSSRFVRSGSCR